MTIRLDHPAGPATGAPVAGPETGDPMDRLPADQPRAFQESVETTIRFLESIAENRALLARLNPADKVRLLQAAGLVSRPDAAVRRQLVKESRRQRKANRVSREEQLLASTGIRRLRQKPIFTTPNAFPPSDPDSPAEPSAPIGEASEPRHCYTCRRYYVALHHFYDQLCPSCAEVNYRKRSELANLSGRVALLTGGRVKIGYQAGLKLLRSGAHLIVTSRFPRDCASRYAQESDFESWRDRLEIFGLDLRHTPSVEAFCQELVATRDRLDFIVNNACQTVRRPPEFYRHMMEREVQSLSEMPEGLRSLIGDYRRRPGGNLLPQESEATTLDHRISEVVGLTDSAGLSQVRLLPEECRNRDELFPTGQLDQDLQQVDLRPSNSWRMLLAEVSSVELLEVQLVNAIAPFILNGRLKPLMTKTPNRDKHIVNVSAVEGQFYRRFKTTRHPHTNMAKAALNMMTRTSATDYFNEGIHMNSVDTGWITDEDPADISIRKTAVHRFHPPLDIVDGAARILDPIITGANTGTHVWGQFLKDYRPTHW